MSFPVGNVRVSVMISPKKAPITLNPRVAYGKGDRGVEGGEG